MSRWGASLKGAGGARGDTERAGYKLSSEAAFGAIDIWRRMRHPNIVGLREAFTSKAFGDNCACKRFREIQYPAVNNPQLSFSFTTFTPTRPPCWMST